MSDGEHVLGGATRRGPRHQVRRMLVTLEDVVPLLVETVERVGREALGPGVAVAVYHLVAMTAHERAVVGADPHDAAREGR